MHAKNITAFYLMRGDPCGELLFFYIYSLLIKALFQPQ